MELKLNVKYAFLQEFVENLPKNFDKIGKIIFQERNTIKIVETNGLKINIKFYKIPHLINRFAYAYIRKSKAKRAYLHAKILQNLSINTPEPIAFINTYKNRLLYKSYYLSIHQDHDFDLKTVLYSKVAEKEKIIRQFTRFTFFSLHQNRVHHLDYSPGNILICKQNGLYKFDLIDLNRMRFEKISFKKGLSNFSKLWIKQDVLNIIGYEYATIQNRPVEKTIKQLEIMNKKHKKKIVFRNKIKKRLNR